MTAYPWSEYCAKQGWNPARFASWAEVEQAHKKRVQAAYRALAEQERRDLAFLTLPGWRQALIRMRKRFFS